MRKKKTGLYDNIHAKRKRIAVGPEATIPLGS